MERDPTRSEVLDLGDERPHVEVGSSETWKPGQVRG